MITFNTEAKSSKKVAAPTFPQELKTEVRSSPSVRKFARSLGIDIATVIGTGSGGRVTRQDVQDATATPVESVVVESSPITTTRPANAQPTLKLETEIEGVQEQTEFGIVIRQPMSQARKAISKAMCHAWEVGEGNIKTSNSFDWRFKEFKDHFV